MLDEGENGDQRKMLFSFLFFELLNVITYTLAGKLREKNWRNI